MRFLPQVAPLGLNLHQTSKQGQWSKPRMWNKGGPWTWSAIYMNTRRRLTAIIQKCESNDTSGLMCTLLNWLTQPQLACNTRWTLAALLLAVQEAWAWAYRAHHQPSPPLASWTHKFHVVKGQCSKYIRIDHSQWQPTYRRLLEIVENAALDGTPSMVY